jgi:hypothetical protein
MLSAATVDGFAGLTSEGNRGRFRGIEPRLKGWQKSENTQGLARSLFFVSRVTHKAFLPG